jgi:tetratricopeptide (TPR) repeat protein
MYNEKALEKYYRSLKISEEIGDKLNIALTLAQVGRLKYELRRYQEAISALSRATSIFEVLESPYLELAMKDLGSIKEEIGEEKFNELIKKLGDKKNIFVNMLKISTSSYTSLMAL